MKPWAADMITPARDRRPWLVWLHGLLGNGGDWAAVMPYFADWPNIILDLPGHGRTAQLPVDFAQVNLGLTATLQLQGITRYIVIGYSLGGRIALYHACSGARPSGLAGLFVEGAHPGLDNASERTQRLENDRTWAERFERQSMEQVLADWYRQPVFSTLTEKDRQGLQTDRGTNRGSGVASMLRATSLGLQPDLLPALKQLECRFGYLCGALDGKFRRLAQQAGLPLFLIPEAGHNAHRANPSAFAGQLHSRLLPFLRNV
ncbi:2-succinyl-6-hydroxy-2,4-cyclohexadiene-1-carboxylate synthase [Biostraticola tofi]|uniref:2-succinyl-6-hydroxy-2,4-cyclohexadiene-1-carboxylate synthase n=1 Tax=Biostraticola tofi TaxID=466109 RepID=A0A4R3Z3C2_9GAMM|nr:2-succinyl-6-hydroxy-2,4-cyclohexadiene-1-carboxylate synthase [Biostraticola tofi]TCW00302.1 2-succinyl-6-hydroxy-2,4-cyclohexadiene-1-carboxylate synthase [Biostraticola tofi]